MQNAQKDTPANLPDLPEYLFVRISQCAWDFVLTKPARCQVPGTRGELVCVHVYNVCI